jgi:hypothetical protein
MSVRADLIPVCGRIGASQGLGMSPPQFASWRNRLIPYSIESIIGPVRVCPHVRTDRAARPVRRLQRNVSRIRSNRKPPRRVLPPHQGLDDPCPPGQVGKLLGLLAHLGQVGVEAIQVQQVEALEDDRLAVGRVHGPPETA